jgi:large subunit ribosomal protein L10
MRHEGAKYKVTKNRISKIAIKGTKYESMSELFAGPTAIAFSDDPVVAPKIASSFAKENDKFSIIGGGLDGVLMSVQEIEQLASLPSLDQLRGKIIGLLNAPAQNIVGVNIAVASKLTRVFQARAEQQ